jgi:hypothetical protein
MWRVLLNAGLVSSIEIEHIRTEEFLAFTVKTLEKVIPSIQKKIDEAQPSRQGYEKLDNTSESAAIADYKSFKSDFDQYHLIYKYLNAFLVEKEAKLVKEFPNISIWLRNDPIKIDFLRCPLRVRAIDIALNRRFTEKLSSKLVQQIKKEKEYCLTILENSHYKIGFKTRESKLSKQHQIFLAKQIYF